MINYVILLEEMNLTEVEGNKQKQTYTSFKLI